MMQHQHFIVSLVILLLLFGGSDLEAFSLCSNYFHVVESPPKITWQGRLELGVQRQQVWGFDLTLTFQFDADQIKMYGRPLIDIRLEKELEYVALNIFNEEKIKFIVRLPDVRILPPPKLMKVEVDYQVVCQQQQQGKGSNDTLVEYYKFDYKLRVPRRIGEKVISTYKDLNFLNCGLVYGRNETNFDLSSLPIVIQKREKWPWLGALFIHNTLQCTAILLSRTVAVVAAHCLDFFEQDTNAVKLEVVNDRYSILNYTIHPHYWNDTKNDIAVLILDRPIFEPDFSSICLWTTTTTGIHETFIGFGKSGMNRIDLMSTLASRNVLQFIQQGSTTGVALLAWSNRWYLKGISSHQTECIVVNTTCDERVTEIDGYHDWLRRYMHIDFDAVLRKLPPVAVAETHYLWILATCLTAILLLILFMVYCMEQQRVISELPLSGEESGVVLTDKKFWRFSHVESTR